MSKTYDICQVYSVAGTEFHTTLESNLTAKQVIDNWPTVSLVGARNDAGMYAVPYESVLLNHYEPVQTTYPAQDYDMGEEVCELTFEEVNDDEY